MKVNFVVADVLTPLLGLETMIHNRLSLSLEHALCPFLVNSAGERTQLEQMGKHLYMIACHSQHGLSSSFKGSLSQPIGVLPSDKNLHEQNLASISSSSTDLDEDRTQSLREQDSVDRQCQDVLSAAWIVHDQSSFDLYFGTTALAASGGEPLQSFYPKASGQNKPTFEQTRVLHDKDPTPSQSWCVGSQEAKRTAFKHKKKAIAPRTSKIQLDYAYIKQPHDKEPTAILTWVESLTGLAGSLMATKKGPTAQQLDAVVTFITRNGFASSTLQCVGEPALVKLMEEIHKQTSLPLDQSSAISHQHEAWQKSLFAQLRALLFNFCRRCKLQPSEVMIGSSLGQHMLRHAEWLLNRFQLSSSDYMTSFPRRWGIASTSAVLPFGELVLAHDQSLAFWHGRCEATDQHILAKANSNSLVKSNSVTRLSWDSSMDLILFKSSSLPPPELPSAAYLKMAETGDQPPAKTGGEKQLRMELPPQACNNQPQQKAKGKQKQKRAVSFQFTSGLAQTASSQAGPYAMTDLAWQQPALQQSHELQLTALHPPVVQQLASATTALIAPVIDPTSRRQPSEELASHQQHESRSKTQKGTDATANKLHSILEKARPFQEIELAVNPSEEELHEAQAALKTAKLHASFDDDLNLFSADEINKAKQKAGESLRGTYEQASRASFTAQQLQQVRQTTWAFEERSSQGGEVSLQARTVNTSFKQQILEPDCESCASIPSHLSFKILLSLSLINKWDILTPDISSALLRAPIANDELVLVQPPLELEQDQDVLWQLTRDVCGITSNLKQWQQCLAIKLEELGLRQNKTDPCIFAREQLIVMIHHGAVLIGGEQHRQESFIAQLSVSISLSNITKLDAKTPLTFLNKTLEHSKQDHSISLHLSSSFYMKLFSRYG